MEINNQGLSLSDLNDLLDSKEDQLKQIFGADFYIRPEGVIDNIVTSVSFLEMLFENECAHLVKQFDPETADSEFLDNLYERIGLKRTGETYTSFYKEILGLAGLTVSEQSLKIRHQTSGMLFVNNESFEFDSTGKANVLFECVYAGATSVGTIDQFYIEESPNQLISIGTAPASDIVIGEEEESDCSFRDRFHNSKNSAAKCSRNSVINNLLAYVNDISYLKVLDGNSDESIPAGKIKIIAKPNTEDQTFANAIKETVPGGVGFLGNTSVSLPLSNGQSWSVAFEKAADVPVVLSAALKVRSGYYSNTVFNNVRKNIISYLQERVFGLNSTVYATEFIIPILEVDGVEAVTDIKVKRSSDADYSSSVNNSITEIPVFSESNILLSVQEQGN